MKSSITDKLDRATLEKWEEVFKETQLERMNLPKETLVVIKVYFCLGYEGGQADMIDNMREIFNNDPCLFEDFFEQNEGFLC